ncbi:MAG: carboxypeptidase-like regulatory domain-containing protein [Flavobacteriaceae bacterium]|nr:carboxypeptidase-like regulatory domain-containing protein [Flavobacteriaceae bacterium]
MKYLIGLLLFLMILSPVFAQENFSVEGFIYAKETREPLPFASISLKNFTIGTTSNEKGQFDIYIPKSMRQDTLIVSYIGFTSYEIPLKNNLKPLSIPLETANNVLDEIVLSNLAPLDYIKMAIKNMEVNAPQAPFESKAYYREKFIENGKIIDKNEAVFKTYYPSYRDSSKNQHQLVLYKPAENRQEFQFMKEWIKKKTAKEKKKADKKGEVYDEEKYDGNIDIDFGGPQSVIDLDIYHSDKANDQIPGISINMNTALGTETSLNGETLVTIIFKSKKTIDNIKDSGKILISKNSYAIAQVQTNGKFSLPFLMRPVLFALGLKLESPAFQTAITYQKFHDYWYPKLFLLGCQCKLDKTPCI